MTEPRIDFGKRRTERQPDAPAPKRSSHVALLVMGTLAVGGGAYAMMGHENCLPAPPAAASQATPATNPVPPPATTCNTSHGWYSGSHWYHGYSRSSSSTYGDSPSSSRSSSASGVSRGGFGSFAHAVGFSGSGG
jgi:hypothetical protein